MSPFSGLTGEPLRTAFVELSESAYEAGATHARHGHEPAYLTAVMHGAYAETIAGRTRVVQSGDLLHHPAGEEHAVRFLARPTHVFRVKLLPAMLEAARLARADFERVRPVVCGARPLIMRMRAVHHSADPIAALAIDALACEMVAALSGGRSRCDPDRGGVLRARDALEAQLARTVSLAELAAIARCHPVTLARLFRRTFGCSIGDYVRRRRLEEACRLLRETGIPISVIALRTGFSDQAHLTRALRRATAVTPGVLRAFKTN